MAKQSSVLIGISILWLPLSMLVDGMNTLILPAYLLELFPETKQASLLGFVSFLGLVLGMLVQVIAGAYSDKMRYRWGRKGMIGLGLLILVPLILLPELLRHVLLLFLVYLLIQAAANIVQAALQGFIPDMIKSEERGLASGLKNLMDIAGALLAFMLLAWLFSEGQVKLALPVIAIVFLISYAFVHFFVHEEKSPTQDRNEGGLHTIFQTDFLQSKAFSWLIAARFLFLLATYAVGRFLLFFVAERLQLDMQDAGEQSAMILTILSLITVLVAPLAGWLGDKFNRRWLMLFGGLVSAIAVILLMTVTSFSQIIIYGSLMAVGSGVFTATNWALTVDYAPSAEAGRFLAIANFGTAGAAAVAGIFGPLIDFGNQLGSSTGYTLLFAASAMAFLGSCYAAMRLTPLEQRPEFEQQLSN